MDRAEKTRMETESVDDEGDDCDEFDCDGGGCGCGCGGDIFMFHRLMVSFNSFAACRTWPIRSISCRSNK